MLSSSPRFDGIVVDLSYYRPVNHFDFFSLIKSALCCQKPVKQYKLKLGQWSAVVESSASPYYSPQPQLKLRLA